MAEKDTSKALATREEPKLVQRFAPTALGLFPEFDDMRRDFERMVSRIFGRGPGGMEIPAFEGFRTGAVDLYETAKDLRLSVEIPGVDQKDINLSVTSDSVTISAERSSTEESTEGQYHWRESSSGSFYRSIQLPVEVKPEEAKATLKNGVLKVTLPRAKASTAKSVKINVE